MSKYNIHIILFTTNTYYNKINILIQQLQLLTIIINIIQTYPKNYKYFNKTLNYNFKKLKKLFNIHNNYQI